LLQGKKIVLGVTGGIAVYKAVDLVSKLRKAGALVRVVMTKSATKFVNAVTFKEISGNPVAFDMWAENQEYNVEHIALAEWADLLLIAPATANIIAKAANGIADDLLSTVILASKAPVVVCPAMNTEMFNKKITQDNLKKIKEYGFTIMQPASGVLACGTTGIGRLPEPVEIVEFLKLFVKKTPAILAGKKVLVTAAGTREPIDPVRYIGNRSSGKMGYSIAEIASNYGADVVLITGPSRQIPPKNIKVINVETTKEMMDAVLAEYDSSDIVIKAAAVADYRVENIANQKIKKNDDLLDLKLVKNPDILKKLGSLKNKQFLVGFAAETQNLIDNAKAKIAKKNLDMIVANDVTVSGAGFNADTNVVKFIYPNGEIDSLEKMPKTEIAKMLLQSVCAKMKK
jgi:phosphopantothenoylcysteine decarboxylase/phosphopantothenate--cysteine ligase